MSVKYWAICLLVAGVAIVIGGLCYLLRSEKEGDAFEKQFSNAFLVMVLGGLLAASGVVISIYLILSRYLHLLR